MADQKRDMRHIHQLSLVLVAALAAVAAKPAGAQDRVIIDETTDLDAAIRTIEGAARSMGLEVTEK